MSDMIQPVGRSIIQHGSGNDRAYLMKLHVDDATKMVCYLDSLATSEGYSKIFAKVPAGSEPHFTGAGYEREAVIPAFFPCGSDAAFLGKYFSEERRQERRLQLREEVLAAARERAAGGFSRVLPGDFTARPARVEDAEKMAELYRQVFATYPFPIHDAGFLRDSMEGSTAFFGIWEGRRLLALSSAEMDGSSLTAEMTDFATLPEYRGRGFAQYLLQMMEVSMRASGIRSLYTIARAYSFGMNVTFARNGYRFGGTLTNNTNISGSLESMNVWYKALE